MELKHSIIKENPYFKSLTDEDYCNLIKHISVENLNENELLFHEGDFADSFYIVKEGAIRITTIDAEGKIIVLARISDGGFFGEQAFSPSSSPRRQASAVAQTDTVLYKFPREVLLNLQRADQTLQATLHEQNLIYFRKKLRKLAKSVQQSSYDIMEMTSNKRSYPKRSIIFYQGDSAKEAYILIHGEVELRCYDKEKQLRQIIDINPGQIFGTEGFSHSLINEQHIQLIYSYTAIVKHNASVVVIDLSKYAEIAKQHPLLEQLYANFNRQFVFQGKSKILQFRSEYLDMPATTSIIALIDGREIVSQQVIGADIFIANVTNCSPLQEIQYTRDEFYSRELRLLNQRIVGILDYGIWEDSHELLKCIIDGTTLTEKQLHEFSETGHIIMQPDTQMHEELICKCMRVSRNTINQLICSQKADLNEISKQTGAGTICGGCKPLLLEMLGTDAWMPCIISKIIDHNADVKSFQLKPTTQNIMPFKPGQYIVVRAKINNAWVQRNYTLTSIPDMPFFEITVKKEQNGIFSPWLFAASDINCMIYISGPYGQFTLLENINTPIVCFMGGIGITPAIAFLRYFVQSKSKQKIYIDYSAYHAEQFILREEFETVVKEHNNIVLNYRITSIHGQLTEQEVKKIISSLDDCHVYMCGPKGLEKLVIDSFNKMNIAAERLHVEQFIHAGAPDNVPQTIELE